MSAISCVQCKMCVYLDEAVNVLRFLTREKAQNFKREIGAPLRKEEQAKLQLPETVSQSAQGHVGRASKVEEDIGALSPRHCARSSATLFSSP